MIIPPHPVGRLIGRRGLDTQFIGLEQQREKLLADLDRLTPAQRAFRPHPESWTIPEVADHLVSTERSILGAARKPDVRRKGRRRDFMGMSLLWGVLWLGVRVKVPIPQLEPRRDVAVEDVRRDWEIIRRQWSDFIGTLPRTQMRQMAFRHPVAGPVRYADVLAFVERHFAHHLRQIKRIRAHPDFPQRADR